MNIHLLASKHKRVKEWRDFLETANISTSLREHISNTTEVYAKVLIDCWKKGTCAPENLDQLASLERELENMNDSVRLSTPETLSREFNN